MHTQGDATGKTTQKATRWCKCAQCATVEAGRARAAQSGMVDKAALVACGCLGDIRVIKSMCLAVRHRGWVIFILPPYKPRLSHQTTQVSAQWAIYRRSKQHPSSSNSRCLDMRSLCTKQQFSAVPDGDFGI